MSDATVGVDDVLSLLPRIRPYRSLVALDLVAFTAQCYFVTHLVLVLSRWGRVRLEPRSAYAEEYLFLAAHVRVVAWLDDPELVGELVAALGILGATSAHPAVQQGRHYLLAREQGGAWAHRADGFYKQ